MNIAPDGVCPECGEELEVDDFIYMEAYVCCKVCYDDYHFGEEGNDV